MKREIYETIKVVDECLERIKTIEFTKKSLTKEVYDHSVISWAQVAQRHLSDLEIVLRKGEWEQHRQK